MMSSPDNTDLDQTEIPDEEKAPNADYVRESVSPGGTGVETPAAGEEEGKGQIDSPTADNGGNAVTDQSEESNENTKNNEQEERGEHGAEGNEESMSGEGREGATPQQGGVDSGDGVQSADSPADVQVKSDEAALKSAEAPSQDKHRVNFTITIAKAIPTAEDEDHSEALKEITRRKRRIVEAPKAQNYYHCEYYLLPDDEEPVKTDVVTFGMAAKVYTEKQEPKVLKTWQDGGVTWVAWTHSHTIVITDQLLLKLFNHTLELRIWNTKDKVSTRARFDRPKAFRLPQAKPGDDVDNIGGVKALVLKQSRSFEKMQPKRSYIDRRLPSQTELVSPVRSKKSDQQLTESQTDLPASSKTSDLKAADLIRSEAYDKSRLTTKESRIREGKYDKENIVLTKQSTKLFKDKRTGAERDMPDTLNEFMEHIYEQQAATPHTLVQEPIAEEGNTVLRSFSRLGLLAGVHPQEPEKEPKTPKSKERKVPAKKKTDQHVASLTQTSLSDVYNNKKESLAAGKPRRVTDASGSQKRQKRPVDGAIPRSKRAPDSATSPQKRTADPATPPQKRAAADVTTSQQKRTTDSTALHQKSASAVAVSQQKRTADTEGMTTSATRSSGKERETKTRRSKRKEGESQAQAELIKQHGICMVPISMATLFAGVKTVTNRLIKPVSGVDDVFITLSLNGPLMSEQQKENLNPMIIKVHSGTDMPSTPLSYDELRLKCMPAYTRYSFFDQPSHVSVGREQDQSIYWDDINVVLAGNIEPSLLRESLNGPALEIEVHDRDRKIEPPAVKPTLFGDDLEDEKISNVGTVGSRRTVHNPFGKQEQPWDPYGVAKFDLSGLLYGQTILHLKSPIHMCSLPDPLGLRQDKSENRLLGIAGAVDGPADSPLAVGHYLESGANLKIKVELAHPLITPDKVAAKQDLETTQECPFGRIVFIFDYQNVQFLQQLQSLVTTINARALSLDSLPQHVIESALSTYKLSLNQQRDQTLDIVTGFQILDGQIHMFVLEGLRDNAIRILWESLPKPENEEITVLYNSDLAFNERLYGPLDVDVCRIKLHEPLCVIVQHPLLYVRDMVPKPCLQALVKLSQMGGSQKLRDAYRNDLFPSAEMVVSMSREFGVPLTSEDFEAMQPEPEEMAEAREFNMMDVPHTSRMWTPIDNYNSNFMQQITDRDTTVKKHSYVKENIAFVKSKSVQNSLARARTMPTMVTADVKTAHNYSIQTLNSTAQANEKLRTILSENAKDRYTYCPDFNHSMTFVPVNIEHARKDEMLSSRQQWRTPAGWTFPGRKTMQESNINPHRPDDARVDELHQPWEENVLHTNKLMATLGRERLTWSKRDEDMDLWRKAPPKFGQEPCTIHLAGSKLKEEKQRASTVAQDQWRSKLVVDDPQFRIHRCATQTELIDRGIHSSNQLSRLQGLLKDEPQKFAFRKPGLAMNATPALHVVLNPAVDTSANRVSVSHQSVAETDSQEKLRGYQPGPYTQHSWVLERNRIPVYNYEHSKFVEKKGQDFNVYHKNRSYLYKRHLQPLSLEDRDNHLFRLPHDISDEFLSRLNANLPYLMPIPGETYPFKTGTREKGLSRETWDSGIGSFIQSEDRNNTIEISGS